ncbi:MAG: hypothetical protein ACRDTC_01935 [Pseudonocardiaceae bacterium]
MPPNRRTFLVIALDVLGVEFAGAGHAGLERIARRSPQRDARSTALKSCRAAGQPLTVTAAAPSGLPRPRTRPGGGQPSPCTPGDTGAVGNPGPLSCADRLCGHGNPTGDRCTLPAGAGSSAATWAGPVVIELDPLWRLVILLAAFGAIPLLLVLGWVARRIGDSCTAVLLRSWWRGYFRRRPHHRPASAPVGPRRARHALRSVGRHARRAS